MCVMFLVFFLLLFLTPSCDELRHGSAPAHLPFKGLGFLVERYIGREGGSCIGVKEGITGGTGGGKAN